MFLSFSPLLYILIIMKRKLTFDIPDSMRDYFLKRTSWGLEMHEQYINEHRSKITESLVDTTIDIMSSNYIHKQSQNNDLNEKVWRKEVHKEIDWLSKALRHAQTSAITSFITINDTISTTENFEYINPHSLQNYIAKYKLDIASNKSTFHSITSHHHSLKGDINNYEEGTTNKKSLEIYANAAVAMGEKLWVREGLKWMEKTIINFFKEGGARKAYIKAFKRVEKEKSGNQDIKEIEGSKISLESFPLDLKESEKIKILDIGSCYNPFASPSCGSRDYFDVTAIDLKPAKSASDVLQCDFLDVKSVPKGESIITQQIDDSNLMRCLKLPENTYDAATISLVLSYLPTPEQRLVMIEQAWKFLRKAEPSDHRCDSGILLIMEKLSCLGQGGKIASQAIKLWKKEITAVGFELITYQLMKVDWHYYHVFAFRAVEKQRSIDTSSNSKSNTISKGLLLRGEMRE